MSALLSRNGQILAMRCLIVGSVLPSVRSRYNFQTERSDMLCNNYHYPEWGILRVFIYSAIGACYSWLRYPVRFYDSFRRETKKRCENASVIFDQCRNQTITVSWIIFPTRSRELRFFFLLFSLFSERNYSVLPKWMVIVFHRKTLMLACL